MKNRAALQKLRDSLLSAAEAVGELLGPTAHEKSERRRRPVRARYRPDGEVDQAAARVASEALRRIGVR